MEKPTKTVEAWAGVFVLVCAISIFVYSSSNEKEPEKIDPRRAKIEACLSKWDGSHMELEKVIKKSMNDPDSYKHDSTQYSDKKDHLLVLTEFRGKNKFGGMVRNTVTAKTDVDTCSVLQIIESKGK